MTIAYIPSSSPTIRPAKHPKLTHTTMSSSTSTSALRLLVQRNPAHPLAKLPTRGSTHAAGYDLYSAEKVVLPSRGGRKVIQTGIHLAIPTGHYGRVAPRSGLASKHGIDTGAGVIDEDYRGLLGVLLFNFGDEDFTVNEGDRIAQLIIEKISTPDVVEVDSLDETLRGAGGFGSTGGFSAPAPAKDAAAAAVAADLPAEVNASSS
ncbi:deoxyuridine 5'-triphosphate nucleotidohydrolase [Pseudozyma hubeiensis SY62]|uniref:Deoxyuridine 5'-triphosphate nucleotidohydrolase n=1 Tax=Pseudozyma hubeiensis (strain SY62) TaxID=1305764 RepID=R9P8A6_PSEHS|nr:deoxyuridine 5'-triphosphate nucleotidohydrolase [Pseudozyma hubeiensis SY62]GAC97482.1 deoxyuridine 5'-triphosphate nucleotidohydrolase [Pseudozyma hubeiensis SY62]